METEEAGKYRDAIRQSNAIFALDGFASTPDRLAVDDAILAGRVSSSKALAEIRAYAAKHRSFDGFVATRTWI